MKHLVIKGKGKMNVVSVDEKTTMINMYHEDERKASILLTNKELGMLKSFISKVIKYNIQYEVYNRTK